MLAVVLATDPDERFREACLKAGDLYDETIENGGTKRLAAEAVRVFFSEVLREEWNRLGGNKKPAEDES